MVYSDILEVLEKADSDGRHLEDIMQKLEEFQWIAGIVWLTIFCQKLFCDYQESQAFFQSLHVRVSPRM